MNEMIALYKINPALDISQKGQPGYPSDTELQAAWLDWLNQDQKAIIRAEIIARYEAEAAKYITPELSKIFMYNQQALDVFRWRELNYPPENCKLAPLISAQAGISTVDLLTAWAYAVDNWTTLAANREAKYLGYIAALEAATFTTIEEAEAFLASVDFFTAPPPP